MYQCCIFDLDGTLVNSVYAIQKAVNGTLEHFGLGTVSAEETRLFAGDGYKKLVERAMEARGNRDEGRLKEALALYPEIFKDCCLYRVEPYDGIRELLAFLRENHIFCAVLSNKPHDRTLDNIRAVFGMESFDQVYGEREDLGIRRKPAPDGVEAILRELGVKKESCLYFGDTNTDMETGKNAGVDTVGVTWGFRSREELAAFHPTLLADHPDQVIAFLKEVTGIE